MTKTPKIHKLMTIFEVLEQIPEAQEILQDFGLYCAGCHLSAYETLEQGILGHGMDEQTLKDVLKALNDAAKNRPDIYVTRAAALKIHSLSEAENKPPQLRVTATKVKDAWTYAMDFVEKPKKSEKILTFKEGITLLLDPKSLKNLKGSRIDYVMTYETEGFKIDNPNED